MIITIDCRQIDSSGTGVYLRECLPFFLKSDHKFILLGNSNRLGISFLKYINIEIIECSIKSFSIVELLFFPKKILRKINNSDLYYSPFFNIPGGIKIPVFSTIHDIIFPDMPELTSRFGLAIRMFFYKRCFIHSKLIFTVSEFSKSRIKNYLGNEKPIVVTHSAIQEQFLKLHSKIVNIKKKEIIVFIGNIKKHKGLNCLLEAFLLAKNEGIPHILIVIGDNKNFRTHDNDFLKKLNSFDQNTVFFTGHITNEQLIDYISSATLLIQPSLYEGFCLPPLEALVLGTQAIISNIPVLKEIYSEYPVIFFQAGDPIDLKNKIVSTISNKTKISLPDHLATKYTFQKTSSIIMENLTAS